MVVKLSMNIIICGLKVLFYLITSINTVCSYMCNLGTLRPSAIKKSKQILLMKSSLFLEAATMVNEAIEQQTIWFCKPFGKNPKK